MFTSRIGIGISFEQACQDHHGQIQAAVMNSNFVGTIEKCTIFQSTAKKLSRKTRKSCV